MYTPNWLILIFINFLTLIVYWIVKIKRNGHIYLTNTSVHIHLLNAKYRKVKLNKNKWRFGLMDIGFSA